MAKIIEYPKLVNPITCEWCGCLFKYKNRHLKYYMRLAVGVDCPLCNNYNAVIETGISSTFKKEVKDGE